MLRRPEQFRAAIEETREIFGDPIREFGFFEKRYITAKAPSWCRKGADAMWINYRDQWKLLTEGMPVWGTIVQANSLMFEPGRHDCPGTVLYARTRRHGDDLIRLSEIASNLFQLKGKHADDPECQRYGDMLEDEMDRAMGIKVPEKITGGIPLRSASVIFHRKHLPVNYLAAGFFPLLIHQKTKSCMVLPSRFWSRDLIEHWEWSAE